MAGMRSTCRVEQSDTQVGFCNASLQLCTVGVVAIVAPERSTKNKLRIWSKWSAARWCLLVKGAMLGEGTLGSHME